MSPPCFVVCHARNKDTIFGTFKKRSHKNHLKLTSYTLFCATKTDLEFQVQIKLPAWIFSKRIVSVLLLQAWMYPVCMSQCIGSWRPCQGCSLMQPVFLRTDIYFVTLSKLLCLATLKLRPSQLASRSQKKKKKEEQTKTGNPRLPQQSLSTTTLQLLSPSFCTSQHTLYTPLYNIHRRINRQASTFGLNTFLDLLTSALMCTFNDVNAKIVVCMFVIFHLLWTVSTSLLFILLYRVKSDSILILFSLKS